MAQNLFEKYGIKEVADVWLSRIERKEETYESQRKIPISSILKSALTLETVYPLDTDGKGADDGYEAYVFTDADVLTHYNYDCDDQFTVIGKGYVVDTDDEPNATDDEDYATVAEAYYETYDETEESYTNLLTAISDKILTLATAYDKDSLRNVSSKLSTWLADTLNIEISSIDISDITATGNYTTNPSLEGIDLTDDDRTVTLILTKRSTYSDSEALETVTIEVPYKDRTNWEVIDAAIIEYYAGEGIDVDESDIYGVYYVSEMTDGTTSVMDLSVISATISFTYTVGGNAYDVTITIDENEDGTTVSDVPITVAYYLMGESDESTKAEKVAALAAFAAVGTTTVELDGEEVEIEIDYTTTSYFGSTISWEVELKKYPIYSFSYEISFAATDDSLYGIFDVTGSTPDDSTHYVSDTDYEAEGTHEFTYAEQVCMIFAKNQNLITKRGTRYQFSNTDTIFGDLEFDDEFAAAPNSTERVVVCGLSGKISENLYDTEEVNEAIKLLTDTIDAKAYDVVYTDYAELVVEDEMGYYMPGQLGIYDRTDKKMNFFASGEYKIYAEAKKGVDIGINSAVSTWGNDKHYSINDAIDALKQEKRLIDGETDLSNAGFDRIFGGYKVLGKDTGDDILGKPNADGSAYDDGMGVYQYTVNGEAVKSAITGNAVHSGYPLDSVLNAISTMESQIEGAQLRVENEVLFQSNRAIYVDASSAAISARAHIYLLKNINAKKLTSDTVGIFEFYDKKGNKLYYQDKVFAGTQYLALVTIGQSGLIFVVERHGTKNIDKIAWMVSDGGYLTNKQAERIVNNGLIHTVDVTVCDESFDATCTVGSIKIRKTKKSVLHYVPVLYLDTLKVSTIEQAAETVDATGGRGNAKLITWDFSKEITLSIEDALFTPASMAAIWGGEHGDVKNGVKDTHHIDRMEKITAKRSFIVPAGNSLGTPTEGDITAQAVYYDPQTMEPFQDGTPIAEGEVIYKFTRSVAYDDNSIGNTIEISAEKFPGTYRVVGETYVRDKKTGEDQRFQFVIPEAKMSAEDTSITLEADGDPVVNSKIRCDCKIA